MSSNEHSLHNLNQNASQKNVMATDFAIRVNKLSKCFQIYDTSRDRLKQFIFPHLRSLFGQKSKQYFREFWALKEMSFDVKKGQALGILGRNGAGKSTLLQILCGTLSPTSGEIAVNGRIAALLELGAGFNPEFTGRENVFMNASLLGLSQQEIEARFNDIVTFADIGAFLEQPVKTYSSGMFVRLAFAIAVHIEPDILIVDEALSVGDVAFRNKCILKIKELRERGTTLLFVSHDLSTLQMICDQVIWLNAGEVKNIGDPLKVCSEYYIFMTGLSSPDNSAPIITQQDTGMARFVQISISNAASDNQPIFNFGEKIDFEFALEALQALEETIFTISVYRNDGDWLIGQTSREEGVFWPAANAGEIVRGTLTFPSICLAPGDYMAVFAAYTKDHSVCYALTDFSISFSVRSGFPTWGKFIHPCKWGCQ